ncbi:MAG: endopeptidase La [Ruminococcaceae bacterium]|nr:endopeptidase La [Oscillospiraceae bacterium]
MPIDILEENFNIVKTENGNESAFSLPVIPAGGCVAFPLIPMSFELTRDVSVNAFNKADETDKTVFLAFCEDSDNFHPNTDELYGVGIISRIEQAVSNFDESVKAVFRGVCRAKAVRYFEKEKIIYAEIIPQPYVEYENGVKEEAFRRHILGKIREIMKLLPADNRGILTTAKEFDDLSQLCDYIAYSTIALHEDKLRILSEYDPLKRAVLVSAALEKDIQVYKEEVIIHQKIQKNMERAHYENYLREKLKVIREELGEDEDEIAELENKVASFKFSDDPEVASEIREKLHKEISRLAKTPFGATEGVVIKNYLDTCLELPWDTVTKDCIDIDKAKEILDGDHDGLEKPKERILEYLAVKQLNPELKNQIICLVGPPGVGKTSLGMSVARAMGRNFARVSLGGIHDEAEIRGHRKTYVGSMPGRIITAIQRAGSRNPVLLLDEIDKMTKTAQGDPASAMLEVLDGEQNKNFRDHYLEVPFDLSDCMFIATANNIQDIPAPLYDRMEIIELYTYTDAEKMQIASHHLIPKQMKRHGLTKKMLRLKEDAVKEIIEHYTRESGVRNLEREIASICRKAAKKIAEGEAKSVTVSKRNIAEYLGPAHTSYEKAEAEDLCGVVNGLAYTSVGGDVLKIETSVMAGEGNIKLTGTLGDVMKESAYIAVSYIRANAENLQIDSDFYKKQDIHIHVPEGATPKDGPSAGITMLTSLTSALSGKKVRHDVAMTGELTLTGRVLPIGGLREKTFAAYKAGVKTVIIPKDNVPDLEEIDKTVREKLEFRPVTKASEVLSIALN